RGNVLYLRNIVEQEVADGRLAWLDGHWKWTGEPAMPPGLVELIESRMGALPTSVSDVIDALAVAEPIALAALTRITDPAAVEEADVRGLITVEPVDGDMDVRLAHPLYGEVRRRRAAPTRLRRLRGLVATELADCEGNDDMRTVVRRAALTLDSDLEVDADLLVHAAKGAVWLADLPLAHRLAKAALQAGAPAEANFILGHVLSWLGRGHEADAVLGAIQQDEVTDADWGRLVFQRAQNMLFALADPAGAKKLIDDAAQTMTSRTRGCIDAALTVYWALMGKPNEARRHFTDLRLRDLPAIVGAGTAMAMSVASGDAGCTAEAVAAADAAYDITQRSFDTAHMRFVIADGHIDALLQAGRIDEARDVANRLHRQGADLPGAQLLSGALMGMAALGGGCLERACALLEPAADAMSGDAVGWGYRYQLPRTIALATRGLTDSADNAFTTLQKRRHPSWRYLDYEFGLARAWVAACQGAVSEAINGALMAAETARGNEQFAPEVMCLQTAAQFGDRS
ncbi:MAG TPA: helix-turn-helix transcriptional regulator, partial [Mycobacterium sp.]|nr:helix-turn-helix transcriptional regulator [Mycobacterium sp.]